MRKVRTAAEWLQQVAAVKADIVSVDLFDTLIYRACRKPYNVFALQFREIRAQLPAPACEEDWVRLRRDVARELARAAAPYEITLKCIYQTIGGRLGLEAAQLESLRAAELAAERKLIRPYPDMINALIKLAETHRICITTDSYLPESFIRELLRELLPVPFDLHCSSATNAPKRSGLAFDRLRAVYPGKKILHCGDNPRSDVKRAEGKVSTCLICHPRPAFLKAMALPLDYLAALGIIQAEPAKLSLDQAELGGELNGDTTQAKLGGGLHGDMALHPHTAYSSGMEVPPAPRELASRNQTSTRAQSGKCEMSGGPEAQPPGRFGRKPKLSLNQAELGGELNRQSVSHLQARLPVETGGAPSHQLSWRWAMVLADFLTEAERYARAIGADEIWMLSRDCEVLYEAWQREKRQFAGMSVKYVYASRAATYPIFAAKDPATFRRVAGRPATAADAATGEVLCAAYESRRDGPGRRILILDAGWKGRMQYALQLAMPESEVYGYYFSLDGCDVPQICNTHACFMPWDASCIRKSAVEALAGFTGDSCCGYELSYVPETKNTRFTPVFRRSRRDRAPSAYKQSLTDYLAAFLHDVPDKAPRPPLEMRDTLMPLRRKILRNLLIFPGRDVAAAVVGWSACCDAAGEAIRDIATPVRLIRPGKGQIWPNVSIWFNPGASLLARPYQALYWLKRARRAET